jgi:hypothetical protein
VACDLPYLKDRRIFLPPPLWNKPRLKADKTEEDYQQSFRAEDHVIYFKLLSKELYQRKTTPIRRYDDSGRSP